MKSDGVNQSMAGRIKACFQMLLKVLPETYNVDFLQVQFSYVFVMRCATYGSLQNDMQLFQFLFSEDVNCTVPLFWDHSVGVYSHSSPVPKGWS